MSDLTVPLRRPGLGSDALTMAARCVRLTARNVESLITSLMLPVMLMLVFVYLFGGAIQTGGRYVTYVVPGVILLCAGFGAAQTAVGVAHDMAGGAIDRFRSLDVNGAALLAGHVAASVARNVVATGLVFGVAYLVGFRATAGPAEWLAAIAVVLAFVVAISALSAMIGLVARTPEAASGYTFLVMFLPYASSAFVPVRTMPSWLHGFAQHQPVTPIIESLRGLLVGTPLGDNVWLAVAWCAGITVVSAAAATVLFRRRVS
ncbi:MAG TPA: ABC transporter permease [Micromonosporaceae bacterium]|nr:ABC transporter permease [Micromonosporaceae bacterium]